MCDFSCAQDVVRRAALRLFLRLDSIPFSADAGGGCLHENGTKRNCAVEGGILDSTLKRPPTWWFLRLSGRVLDCAR